MKRVLAGTQEQSGAVAAMKADFATTSTNFSDLRGQITGLQTNVDRTVQAQSAELATLKSDLALHRKELSGVSDQVNKLQTSVNLVLEVMGNLVQEVQAVRDIKPTPDDKPAADSKRKAR